MSERTFPPETPPSFHLLAKCTGSTCNLACAYCFFLEKERLYPGQRSRMSDELLELLRQGRVPAEIIGRYARDGVGSAEAPLHERS